jgi:hypothetical protein
MANNTVIQQGNFTSTGVAEVIKLRSDIDWMEVYNVTIADANQTTAVGVEFYWQRGFASDRGWEYKKSSAANAANMSDYLATGGFTYVDSSGNPNDALNATGTDVSNAAIPVVTNSGVNALVAGDVVRLINIVTGQQLGGLDFTVGHNTLSDTTFSLDYMSAVATATTGSWRRIKFDPLYYPRHRYITGISAAGSAVITMSVTHGYKVGQKVRFVVPAAYAMIEMNDLCGTITAIDTTLASGNTITVNIDSSAFTAFAFPVSADVPFSPAMVIPLGMDTAQALSSSVDILSDATLNEGYIGMSLAAGADSPAGATSDVIYWRAGKSFSVSNV